MIRMTSYQQKYILMLHNQWRNKIALGNIPGYKSAERMPVMVCFHFDPVNIQIKSISLIFSQEWSKELSYLAELNARSCEYGHDDCRATGNSRRPNSIISSNSYIYIYHSHS